MNLFEIIFLNVILFIFPILVYLIYLSTNKNITDKSKKIYLCLSLLTSFFIIYSYGIGNFKLISILMISAIVILLYLEDLYVISNFFLIVSLLIYNNYFNSILFLLIGYILIQILYLIKKHKKIKNILFIQIYIIINSLVFYLWIYTYNNEYYNKELLIITVSYFFIINIICLLYETGKRILEDHMTYKELKKEKQIRLSLFKITHEIKNPIAVCKGYLDMLNTKDTNQVERYVPILKSEIERLLSLLQDFLLINKDNLDLDIMDFNMLLDDTLDKLNPLLRNSNINVEKSIIDDEIFVNGDYNRLSQVLINILKNSIESMEEVVDGKINISTKINNNKYYLIIEDNGIGMNKDVLSKIKEPFFTTKKRGSGLGVSLIYEIIEAHDGEVEYLSTYGKGTKVIIQIPLYE